MLIEIHGAGFQNKGAELMLRTTVSELRSRLPQFIPAIDPLYGEYESRCSLGLWQILPPRSHVGTPGFAQRFQRQRRFATLKVCGIFRRLTGVAMDMYGMATLAAVQGFIDISGFAYTDQWGAQPTVDLASLTRYYKQHNKPVILLPQAFGPFERPETRAAFAEVLHNADLVFPRDKQSWDYAAELASNPEKLVLAPEMTLFGAAKVTSSSVDPARYVCIIPNIRLLDQGKDEWMAKYATYLTQIIGELIQLDIQPRLLIHDTSGGDLHFAETLVRELASSNLEIIQEPDPLALKHIIGNSLFVIGSRYHGLVAAFAQAVPAIGLGWAHKYEMLFSDFGCERFVIAPSSSLEVVLERVRELADPSSNETCRKQISTQLARMYPVNQAMWERVANLLKQRIE